MATSDEAQRDPSRWSVPQLRDWIKRKNPSAPLKGKKLELVAQMKSIIARDAVEAELEAEERPVETCAPPSYSLLPKESTKILRGSP